MKDTIRSTWVNWVTADRCPLCKKEGKDIANVWRKGHTRRDGIMLEDGISYCSDCAETAECEEDWKQRWEEMWKKEQAKAKRNYVEYGVYTNVSGTLCPVSFHFGEVPTKEGFLPYLMVYPDCPKYKLEEVLRKVVPYNKDKADFVKAEEIINNSSVDEDFKDIMRTSIAKIKSYLNDQL